MWILSSLPLLIFGIVTFMTPSFYGGIKDDPLYTHTIEGPDDIPSHIKAALTATSLGIPVLDGRLALGTWQGLYLWEHRRRGSEREVLVHVAA